MGKRINKDDLDRFHDYGIYIPSRTLYMGSETIEEGEDSGTDALAAARIIKNLLVLDSLSNDPIVIILNNPGGDVNHGLSVYDAVKACRSHVTIKVFGQASSIGSVILQAADERVMSENACQMIHYGKFSVDAVAKTAYRAAAESKRLVKWMEQTYFLRIKEKLPEYKLAKLQKMLDNDTFLTADQSVALGLADKVEK